MTPSLRDLFGGALPEAALSRRADLEAAAGAALRGGRAVLRHYGSAALEVRDKGPDDPVTEADQESNREVLAFLRRHRPRDPVRSEESEEESEEEGTGAWARGSSSPPARLWVVDPLDGTKEFLARNGEFSVMVGLAEEGRAALGAVYRPEPDLLYLGIADRGAWVVAEAQRRPKLRPLAVGSRAEGPIRLTRSRSHPDEALERLREALGEGEVVPCGSVGMKCALIAAGEADLYVHPVPHLKEWDTCAPEAILRGAGGRVTDCGGEPLRYGKADPRQRRGIFAAAPDVWTEVAAAVRQAAGALLEPPGRSAGGARPTDGP